MDLKILRDTPPWDWPQSAGQTLLQALTAAHASESDRVLAAQLAGDLIVASDHMVEALLALVRDGAAPPRLRAQAAISLGPVLEYADTEGFEDEGEAPISEKTFHLIKEALRDLFRDATVPREVRRRILESCVRAPDEWHAGAVGAAHASDEEDWKLTAVFCMRYLRGFEREILEALGSRNREIQAEAIHAAGEWSLKKAWPHVAPLLKQRTPKPLLLAAIAAAPSICSEEAQELLNDLADSDDEDIAEAIEEALALAETPWDEDDEETT